MRFWVSSALGIAVVTTIVSYIFYKNPEKLTDKPNIDASNIRDDVIEYAEETPRLEIENETIEVGVQPQFEANESVFKIVNKGSSPLKFQRVSRSCVCVDDSYLSSSSEESSKDSKDDLGAMVPANSTAYYHLTWDTAQRVGKSSFWAVFETNDPGKLRVTLQVDSIVQQELLFSPQVVKFLRLTENQAVGQDVKVYSLLRDDLNIEEIISSDPYVVHEFRKMTSEELTELEAKSGYIVTISTKEDIPVGGISGFIELKTNLQTARKSRIYYNGVVEGEITISQKNKLDKNVIEFGNVSHNSDKEIEVDIFAKGLNQEEGETLKIGEIDPPFIEHSLEKNEKYPTWYKMRLKLPGKDMPPGVYMGVVILQNQKDEIKINLPIRLDISDN